MQHDVLEDGRPVGRPESSRSVVNLFLVNLAVYFCRQWEVSIRWHLAGVSNLEGE